MHSENTGDELSIVQLTEMASTGCASFRDFGRAVITAENRWHRNAQLATDVVARDNIKCDSDRPR